MPSRYAIQLAYDGTDYCGWQIQRGVGSHENPKPSIEGLVTQAIAESCGETVTVVASGRTDAGVHASGQVAHFDLESPRDSDDHFIDGLNTLLPGAIRVHQFGPVPSTFHAQKAIRKQYSYYFQQGAANLPHLSRYTFWDRYALDEMAMQVALQSLMGKHDFLGFSSTGANVSSTVREIHEVEVTRKAIPLPGCFDARDQSLIQVRILGSGFLKQMVRTIAGTLKQIGEGRRPAEEMDTILQSCDRKLAGPTAPACGLWLDRVWYEPQPGVDFLNGPG